MHFPMIEEVIVLARELLVNLLCSLCHNYSLRFVRQTLSIQLAAVELGVWQLGGLFLRGTAVCYHGFIDLDLDVVVGLVPDGDNEVDP